MIKEFLFEASNAAGKAEQDSVVAVDVADARAQLERMGYSAIRVLTGEIVPQRRPPNVAANGDQIAAQSRYDPMPRAVARTYLRDWKWWVPGLAVLGEALWSGRAPYPGAGLLVAGLALVSTITLPMVLYNQALQARVDARRAAGLRYLALFRRLNLLGGHMAMAIAGDRAKLLAGDGDLERALQEFAAYADDPNRVAYLTQLAAIYDCAGEHEHMIATQRAALAASDNSAEMRIDVAWSLARYTTRYEEARALIAGIDEHSLAELGRLALMTVQGLLLQAAERHRPALEKLRMADTGLAPLTNPLVVGTRRELHGYMALSLKALGKLEEAEGLWSEAKGQLRKHHHYLLIKRYELA